MATETIIIEVDDYTQEWSKSGGSSHTEYFEDGTISRSDWGAIPEGATITRVSVTGKITVNSSLTITMYFGAYDEEKLCIPCTLSGNYMRGWTVSGECDGASFLTRDELITTRDIGFYGKCEQKSSMTSGSYEASFTDFAVTIEYELGGSLGKVTIGGVTKEISSGYANINGTWVEIGKPYINVDGVWVSSV